MPKTVMPITFGSFHALMDRFGYDLLAETKDSAILHWQKRKDAAENWQKILPSHVTFLVPDHTVTGSDQKFYDRNHIVDFLHTILGLSQPKANLEMLAVLKVTDLAQARELEASLPPPKRSRQKNARSKTISMATKPQIDDPDQSQRFVTTAAEVGAEETAESFDRAFKTVVHPKPKAG